MNNIKAIIYDYDGTLTPDAYPVFAIVEKAGVTGGCSSPEFQKCIREEMKNSGVDFFTAFIVAILDVVKSAGYKLTDDNIALGASQRKYQPGVPEFMQKVQAHGIANYLLSSGSKAYLEHTAIAQYCADIYGSTLRYDGNGEATEPDHVMDTEAKVDVLRKIAQSFTDSPEDCTGLVYIGDGPTDIPVMTYVKEHGGETILVQDPATRDDVERQLKELAAHAKVDEAIMHRFPADFRDDAPLSRFIFSEN